jgi:hypothetical protein
VTVTVTVIIKILSVTMTFAVLCGRDPMCFYAALTVTMTMTVIVTMANTHPSCFSKCVMMSILLKSKSNDQ